MRVEQMDAVAALVNNAGILETQMRVEQMDARLQRIMQANVVGPSVRPRGGAPDVRGTAARAASSSMCPRPPRAWVLLVNTWTMRRPRARSTP